MRLLFIAVVLSLLSGLCLAKTQQSFDAHYLFDASGELVLDEILNKDESQWTAAKNDVVGFDVFESEYYQANTGAFMWVRIAFEEIPNPDQVWLELMPNVGHNGEIALFQNGEWRWHGPVGTIHSDKNDLPSRYLSFAVDPRVDGKTAYIKLNTQQIFNFLIQAKSLNEMISAKVWHTLFFGFIAGALMLALVYNGVIGYVAKEKLYNYYALYVFFVVVYITAVAGYIRVIFPGWENAPTFTNASVLTVMGSVILFARELLDTQQILPKLDKILKWTLYCLAAGLIVIAVSEPHVGYYVSEVFGMSIPMLVLLVAAMAVQKRHPMANYFMIAWVLVITTAAYWSWMWLGLIEPSQGLVNMLLIGIAAEVLLLSVVLGLKFSKLKQQTKRLTEDKQKFKSLSEVDELTGILNRRGFLNHVEGLVTARKHFVWLALDIDHFKRFNDTHGHLAGDQALAELGALLRKVGRRDDIAARVMGDSENKSGDVVGRIGGEEFAVILVDCPIKSAHIFVDRLRAASANLRIQTESGEDVGITLSIGGTALQTGESYKKTWKRADDLLYEAKESGRDRAILR